MGDEESSLVKRGRGNRLHDALFVPRLGAIENRVEVCLIISMVGARCESMRMGATEQLPRIISSEVAA
jgi:hypothetical protein